MFYQIRHVTITLLNFASPRVCNLWLKACFLQGASRMPVVWLLQVMQDWKTYEPNQCVMLWTHTSIQSGELGIPMSRRRRLRKRHRGCLLLRPALNCKTRSPLNAARRTNGHSFLKALNNVLGDIFHNMTYCLKRRVEYFNALEPKSSFKHTASSLLLPPDSEPTLQNSGVSK